MTSKKPETEPNTPGQRVLTIVGWAVQAADFTAVKLQVMMRPIMIVPTGTVCTRCAACALILVCGLVGM